MAARDWFVLALRIVGVVLLLYGLRDLVDHLLYRLGYFNWTEVSPLYFVVTGVVQIAAGLYLVRGAPLLTRFAFPATDTDDEEDPMNDERSTTSDGL
jgi:hypothetical protein